MKQCTHNMNVLCVSTLPSYSELVSSMKIDTTICGNHLCYFPEAEFEDLPLWG